MTRKEQDPATLRQAVPGDATAVRQLVRAAYAHYVPRLGREPRPMRDDYTRRIAEDHMWVLEAHGELVGVVVLSERPGSFLLENIAVAPAAQGIGYGKRLMTFAEDQARQRGHTELRLYTNVLMVENIALYQHLGFREIGRIHEHGFERVYMAKAL